MLKILEDFLLPKSDYLSTKRSIKKSKNEAIVELDDVDEAILIFWLLLYRYSNNTIYSLLIIEDMKFKIVNFVDCSTCTYKELKDKYKNIYKTCEISENMHYPILFFKGECEYINKLLFDLAVIFDVNKFQIIYNEKMFSLKTIKRLILNYKFLTKEIHNNQNQSVERYEIVSQSEKDLLCSFNIREKDYDDKQLIIHKFYDNLPMANENIAIYDGINQLTYNDFNQITNYYASLMIKSKSKYLAIISNYDIATCIGIFAALKAGKSIVAINSSYPKDRIMFILNQLEIKLLFISENIIKMENNSDYEIISFSETDLDNRKSENIINNVEYEDICYIIYTSGTTGEPKGVKITQKNINIEVNYLEQKCKFEYNSGTLHLLDYSFDFGLYDILSTLIYGRTLFCINRKKLKNLRNYVEYINDNSIRNLNITPTLMNILCSFKIKMPSLMYVHLGGEKVTYEMLDKYLLVLNDKCDIYNGYGPCECTIGSALHLITDEEKKNIDRKLLSIPIGSRTDHSELFILDKYNNFIPLNAIGELCIAGDSVGKGYVKDSLNENKFVDCKINGINKHLYRTGDLVRYLENGEIEFITRMDNQIKKNGFRIELSEIDNILQKNMMIQESKTIFINHIIVSFVVKANKDINSKDIVMFLHEKMPSYMIPTRIVFLEQLPFLASGKVDIRALEQIL